MEQSIPTLTPEFVMLKSGFIANSVLHEFAIDKYLILFTPASNSRADAAGGRCRL